MAIGLKPHKCSLLLRTIQFLQDKVYSSSQILGPLLAHLLGLREEVDLRGSLVARIADLVWRKPFQMSRSEVEVIRRGPEGMDGEETCLQT